jgi:hypothetical protein
MLMRLLAVICAVFLTVLPATAQVTPAATTNNSVKITTGATFQSILTAIPAPPTPRRSLTIENNNINGDNCWINVDGSVVAGNTSSSTVTINSVAMSAATVSMLLAQGGSYARYFPYIPSGPVVGTCTGTNDTIYVDVQ